VRKRPSPVAKASAEAPVMPEKRGGKGGGKEHRAKVKLVRDSFTIPKDEYSAIASLKKRAMSLGREVKKSELLRAGLMALAGLSDSAFGAMLAQVPSIKTGRPRADG
jgi:hypothetical protein